MTHVIVLTVGRDHSVSFVEEKSGMTFLYSTLIAVYILTIHMSDNHYRGLQTICGLHNGFVLVLDLDTLLALFMMA